MTINPASDLLLVISNGAAYNVIVDNFMGATQGTDNVILYDTSNNETIRLTQAQLMTDVADDDDLVVVGRNNTSYTATWGELKALMSSIAGYFFDIQTPSNGYVFTLRSRVEDDFEVNWGDGSVVQTVSPSLAEVPHTYATAGTYTVTVKNSSGGVYSPFWNNTGDRTLLASASDSGVFQFGPNLASAWYGCTNLTSFDFSAISSFPGTTNFTSTWRNTRIPEAPEFTLARYPNGTTFTRAFSENPSLTSFPGWAPGSLANVVSLERMFLSCSNLTGSISGWDTAPNLVNARDVFNSTSITYFEGWGENGISDLSNLEELRSFFAQCKQLTHVGPDPNPATSWYVVPPTPNLKLVSSMFFDCNNAEKLPQWTDLSSIESINSYARGTAITSIPPFPSNFNASGNLALAFEVFFNCRTLTTCRDINGVEQPLFPPNSLDSVTDLKAFFSGAYSVSESTIASFFANHSFTSCTTFEGISNDTRNTNFTPDLSSISSQAPWNALSWKNSFDNNLLNEAAQANIFQGLLNNCNTYGSTFTRTGVALGLGVSGGGTILNQAWETLSTTTQNIARALVNNYNWVITVVSTGGGNIDVASTNYDRWVVASDPSASTMLVSLPAGNALLTKYQNIETFVTASAAVERSSDLGINTTVFGTTATVENSVTRSGELVHPEDDLEFYNIEVGAVIFCSEPMDLLPVGAVCTAKDEETRTTTWSVPAGNHDGAFEICYINP